MKGGIPSCAFSVSTEYLDGRCGIDWNPSAFPSQELNTSTPELCDSVIKRDHMFKGLCP